MVNMNRLSTSQRIQVVRCLVEGNSIRGTVRMTGAAKNTVAKLLVELGLACQRYQDEHLRDLPCRRIQCDEIWSFVGAKMLVHHYVVISPFIALGIIVIALAIAVVLSVVHPVKTPQEEAADKLPVQ